jgi:hypothetical protein
MKAPASFPPVVLDQYVIKSGDPPFAKKVRFECPSCKHEATESGPAADVEEKAYRKYLATIENDCDKCRTKRTFA